MVLFRRLLIPAPAFHRRLFDTHTTLITYPEGELSPGTSTLGVLLQSSDRNSGVTAGMAQWARRIGVRPALETNRLPATIVEEGFPAVNDVCRAFGTASRVVIGADDALERVRTIVGGRHWFSFRSRL